MYEKLKHDQNIKFNTNLQFRNRTADTNDETLNCDQLVNIIRVQIAQVASGSKVIRTNLKSNGFGVDTIDILKQIAENSGSDEIQNMQNNFLRISDQLFIQRASCRESLQIDTIQVQNIISILQTLSNISLQS